MVCWGGEISFDPNCLWKKTALLADSTRPQLEEDGEAELVHQTVLCKLQKPYVSMAVICELLWFHFVLLDAD